MTTGKTDLLGDLRRLRLVLREFRRQRVESVALQELQAVQLAQAGPPGGETAPDHLLRFGPVVLELERREVLAVQPVGVLVERPQGLGRILGKLVDRIAVFLEVFHPGGDIDHPHEAAEDRLGGAAGDADDRLGRPQGVRHRLRGEDDQGAVHPFVLDHGGEGRFRNGPRGRPR